MNNWQESWHSYDHLYEPEEELKIVPLEEQVTTLSELEYYNQVGFFGDAMRDIREKNAGLGKELNLFAKKANGNDHPAFEELILPAVLVLDWRAYSKDLLTDTLWMLVIFWIVTLIAGMQPQLTALYEAGLILNFGGFF